MSARLRSVQRFVFFVSVTALTDVTAFTFSAVFVFRFSYSKVLEQKEELEQKHLHLLQILDSERQAKWHYVQQTEELTTEVKKLKNEVRKVNFGDGNQDYCRARSLHTKKMLYVKS